MYMHALTGLYLHVFAQKLRKAARRLTRQLSIPNTFPFKWFSNAVVYNFNQSVNSLAGFSRWFLKWQSVVHQTDCIPPSCSILLFFFYHLPSIPKPAVIPTVRRCCLADPDLWNDDRGARAPYPSVFICPSPFHRRRRHRLPYARLSPGCGHSDGDGCSRSDRAGDPPKVISAPASTCSPGPSARPLQVRGQRVMEGTVTRSRKGRRGREECWSEKRKFTKSSSAALSGLCFLCVPLLWQSLSCWSGAICFMSSIYFE